MYLNRYDESAILTLYTGDYKKAFYLREISRLAHLPLKNTQRLLFRLESSAILKSEPEGRNKYFTLHLENIQTRYALLQAEIYKSSIFLERTAIFGMFAREIPSSMPVIIFGSFAKYSQKKNSDADLLVISENGPELPSHLLPNQMHLLTLTKKDFSNSLKRQEVIIQEILENHIILNDHSFFVNALWDYYGEKKMLKREKLVMHSYR